MTDAQARVSDSPLSHALLRARVARTALLQRALTINHVDFDPVEGARLTASGQPDTGAFTNWTVDPAVLTGRLTPYLKAPAGTPYPDANAVLPARTLAGIRDRLATIGTLDLAADDVPALAVPLTAHLKFGAALTPKEVDRLQLAVETALAEASFTLPGYDGGADFDTLVAHAGGGSRRKGIPSTIRHDQLPSDMRASLRWAFDAVGARNRELVNGKRVFTKALSDDEFSRAASEGLEIVRTFHTNRSGWLPTVNVPARIAPAVLNPLVTARLPAAVTAEFVTGPELADPNNVKAYSGIVAHVLGRHGGSRRFPLVQAWSAYAQGNPYVELSAGGSEMTRLIYDYVNAKFFISAHYHWHRGYNPFFEITGVNDL